MAVALPPIDQLVGQRQSDARVARDTGAAQAAVGSMVSGISQQLQNRWWQKEAQEFNEGPAVQFAESVSALGRMAGDDSAIDVEGAMEIYTTAVKDFIGKAAQYKDNPIITQSVKGLLDTIGKQGTDLASGERDLRAAQTGLTGAQEGTEYARAGLLRAQTGAIGGDLTKFPFRLDRKMAAATPTAYTRTFLETSEDYRKTFVDAARAKAGRQWGALKNKFDYNNDFEKYAEGVFLTDEEKKQNEAEQLKLYFAHLYPGMDSAGIEAQVKAAGVDLTVIQAADAAKGIAPPVFFSDEQMDAFILNKLGAPPLGSITNLKDLDSEDYKGSAAQLLTSKYIQLRKIQNLSHDQAVEQIATSKEEGGSGFLEEQTGKWFEKELGTSPFKMQRNKIVDSNITNFRDKLIDFMNDNLGPTLQAEEYEVRIISGDERAHFDRVKSNIRDAMRLLTGVQFPLGVTEFLKSPIDPLARKGLRTGGLTGEAPEEKPSILESISGATGSIRPLLKSTGIQFPEFGGVISTGDKKKKKKGTPKG